MPEFGGVENFDRTQNGLVPIPRRNLGVLRLINLDDHAAPLTEFLGALVQRVAPLGIASCTTVDRRTTTSHCN